VAKTFTHDQDANRYVLRIDDELIAAVDYVVNGDSVSFNHTFTNPSKRGQGFAAEIVQFAVDDVEKNSQRYIVPMCWYVGEWFDKHPERAALLSSRAA
jgi:predicted GNAT family acetyltransferase